MSSRLAVADGTARTKKQRKTKMKENSWNHQIAPNGEPRTTPHNENTVQQSQAVSAFLRVFAFFLVRFFSFARTTKTACKMVDKGRAVRRRTAVRAKEKKTDQKNGRCGKRFPCFDKLERLSKAEFLMCLGGEMVPGLEGKVERTQIV